MKVTKCRINEDHGGPTKDKGCVDQIFVVKITVEKHLAKGQKLYAVFRDLEKAYDKVEWNALQDVLRIYGGTETTVVWCKRHL